MTQKRNPEFVGDDLESEFDYTSELERKKARQSELQTKQRPGEIALPGRDKARAVFDEEHGRVERQKRRFLALDAYSRHKQLINHYYLYYPGATKRLERDTSRDRNDVDVLRENHRFLWSNEDSADSWEAKLAKKYYDKLYKEYCIADLSRYRENKNEVVTGKGQFQCGNKKCDCNEQLTSWEVNFAYVEAGVKKNALVKIRLCPKCSDKLNFHTMRRKVERKPKKPKKTTTDTTAESDHVAEEPSREPKIENTEDLPSSSNAESSEKSLRAQAKEIWSQPAQIEVEKSRADEFEEFLDDLLL